MSMKTSIYFLNCLSSSRMWGCHSLFQHVLGKNIQWISEELQETTGLSFFTKSFKVAILRERAILLCWQILGRYKLPHTYIHTQVFSRSYNLHEHNLYDSQVCPGFIKVTNDWIKSKNCLHTSQRRSCVQESTTDTDINYARKFSIGNRKTTVT